jgi:iron complex outermembrane recepter protein
MNSRYHAKPLTCGPVNPAPAPPSRTPRHLNLLITLLLSAFFILGRSPSAICQKLPEDLTELSIEDLMNIEVTTVARKSERLGEAAAAVFVITSEDIQRSGATTIPDLLRMVPGLQVARIDANKWAVSARGFNGRIANKLLVLMDGRSVYSPFYSGVFWDVQDTLLEEIDRIEVIRGPGAALWGANAVNGVINIITKHSRDSQKMLVTTGVGTEELNLGAARYGGHFGSGGYYRAYVKGFERDSAANADGDSTYDAWGGVRGGFRIDLAAEGQNEMTFQGDYYNYNQENTAARPILIAPYNELIENTDNQSGGNLILRWQKTLSPKSDLGLQIYYDQTLRGNGILTNLRKDTLDVDYQHRFLFRRRHEILWGLGYRLDHDETTSGETVRFDPENHEAHLFSAFLQDEITLAVERLYLTLGSKFEHNDYTGWEIQPNSRLLWTPTPTQSAWAAVSRAVRTPSRAENDARFIQLTRAPDPDTLQPVTQVVLEGSEAYESETLLAYELGYRFKPIDRLSMDLAGFYNEYDHLRTIEYDRTDFSAVPGGGPAYVIYSGDNKMSGTSQGIELALELAVTDNWRLKSAYTYLTLQLDLDRDSSDQISEIQEDESPQHQLSLRSLFDMSRQVQLDLWLRYVDQLKGSNIDDYLTLDARLGYCPAPGFQMELVGRNLVEASHPEFSPEIIATSPSEVERSVYGKITLSF